MYRKESRLPLLPEAYYPKTWYVRIIFFINISRELEHADRFQIVWYTYSMDSHSPCRLFCRSRLRGHCMTLTKIRRIHYNKEELMEERTGIITFQGNPLTLVGKELKPGTAAPDFRVVDNGLAPVTLADYSGKIKILSAVPSLDTPVCDTETRRFNKEAATLPDNIVVLTISMDLPFAQARWCGAAGIDRVKTLSDYQERSFARPTAC